MQKDVHPIDPVCFGEQELLTPREAAAYIRVSKSYLDKLRVYGGGPMFLRFGRKILYRKFELNRWAEQRCFGSTSEYADSPASLTKDLAVLRSSGEHQ